MNDFPLPQVTEPYKGMLAKRRIWDYVNSLCDDGISWWFEMKIPEIAAHLQPLRKYAVPGIKPPPRILLLVETVQPAMSTKTLDKLFHKFEKQGDVEAMAASACAGATSIWDSGVEFERFTFWHERIVKLIDGNFPMSDLARAGLLCFRAQSELTFYGDMEKSLQTYRELMSLSEKAGSLSLKVFSAAGQVYPLLWLGRISEIDALMMSVSPLQNQPEVSLFCNVYFLTSLGLGLTVKGEPAKGEALLGNLVAQPFYSMLSPSIQLLGLGHLLTALAFQKKVDEVKLLAEKILAISTPMSNSFHSSYAHYCVGVSHLLLENSRKALTHAREAIARGKASASPIPERTNPLLEGQALLDLGETKGGVDLLTEWIEKWINSRFFLYASAGLAEIASVSFKQGKIEEARQYYEKSVSLIPKGEQAPQLHRHPHFIRNLEKALLPAEGTVEVLGNPEDAMIHINTFGELKIDIGGRKIYDRKWRGGATKTLLKAIVALGGKKISNETIFDLIWPDADGVSASQNLKVAIHRLKKVCVPEGSEPLSWLVVKHKSVSLSGTLCYVDSIYFENSLSAVMKNGADINRLVELLSLYTDDFLVNDTSETWIIRRRELLQNKFTRAVIFLSDLAMKEGDYKIAIPYLEKAIDKNPVHEESYERLMALHIGAGYHSKALIVFKQAEAILKCELDAQPGSRLAILAEKAHNGTA